MDINDLQEAIDLLLDSVKQKEQRIFDILKAKVFEGQILILPEMYHSVIGDFSKRIKFSPFVTEDKYYIMDKKACDINIEKMLLED